MTGNGFQKGNGTRRFFAKDISVYTEKWFFARSFVCGPEAEDFFGKLFGLEGNKRVVLRSVCWEKDRFKLTLWNRETGRPALFVLKRYSDEELSLYARYEFRIADNGFVLLYRKEKAGPGLDGILEAFLRNLGRIDPADLFYAVYSGKKRRIRVFPPAAPPAEEAAGRPEYYQWGREGISRVFLLNEVLMDQLCGEIDFSENSNNLRIKCGDIECFNKYHPLFLSEPEALIFNTYGKYRTFLENLEIHQKNPEKKDLFFRKVMLANSLIEFREKEVVFGSDLKIFRILSDIVRIIRKKDISLSVVDTCINRIIGSDLDSFVAKLKKKNKGLKIVYEGQHNNPSEKELIRKEFGELILRSLKSVKRQNPFPRCVNLIGFEQDRSTAELSSLLERFFRIRVNTVLFPRVDPASLCRFNRAGVDVVNSFRIYADSYEAIVSACGKGRKALQLTPPYGLRETARWLGAITGIFGISMEQNREWRKYWHNRMREFSGLARRASLFRLGFVISGSDVKSLLDPSRFLYGIPLLPFLEEMGFGLNILFTASADFDRAKESLLGLLRHGTRHRIELMNHPDQWEERISALGIACVYSDFRNDMRIIQRGLNPFSLFLLEKGPEGALRSQREILRLCNMDFYKKYSRYRGKTAGPLPDEENFI